MRWIFCWFFLDFPDAICRNCRIMSNTLARRTWKYHRIFDHCTKLEALEGALEDQTGGAGNVSICQGWDVSSLSWQCDWAESLQFNLSSFVFTYLHGSLHVLSCAYVCIGSCWMPAGLHLFFCSLGGNVERFFHGNMWQSWHSDDQCHSRWQRQRVIPECSDASKNAHCSMADAEAVHLFKSR